MPDLTQKELKALEHQLRDEDVLVAKFKDMANNCNDQALANTFNDIANKHQQHYDTLYQFLI